METPFDVLRVDPDASDRELVRAYRRRVKESHPDQGGSTEEFRRVKEAYEAIRAGEVDPGEQGGNAGDGSAEPGRETSTEKGDEESEEAAETEPGHSVEYLNYETIVDRGWEIDDPDLFEKAAAADLEAADYGQVRVEAGEYLLDSVEDCGLTWPYSCRGGACANCAVAVIEGDLSTPVNHILPPEMVDRDIRLSCVGTPITDDLRLVYNVKHLPGLDELRLPPGPFERANLSD